MARTTRSIWGIAMICASLAACIEGFDNFNGSDEAYYRLFDYVIDRPRVLAVTWWPPGASGGDTVTFRALAATPDNLRSPEVSWWACGLNLDTPFIYYGADCMQTSLAEFLGTGPSLSVQLPYYDLSGCQESGNCYGYIPVIAVVQDPDGNDKGQGITFLTPDYYDRVPEPDMDEDAWNATLQLRIDNAIDEPATARPGDSVHLEAILPSSEPECTFSWYTSEGTFLDYGVTSVSEASAFPAENMYLLTGTNTLIVPDDPSDSIQVYVVTTPFNANYAYLTRFATGTIEVVP